MASTTSLLKRVVLGRPQRSDRLGHTLLPKRIALPVFASDPLSSVAYATQEILLILTLGGLTYLYMAPWIAGAVVVLLAVVVLSYRQVVRAYPSGGGSYEVVSENLGALAGLVVAAALLVDYVMTVAVSVAAGVDNIISAIPDLNAHRVALCIGFIVLLTAMNLRGIRESGRAFAAPTYAFVAGVMVMIAIGLVRALLGDPPQAESANYQIHAEQVGLNTLAVAFLVLRAFSSGCTALTGVEAISNGVPAFRKPKALNAARTMAAMGAISITMFTGVTALALIAHTRVTENTCDLIGFAGDCTTDPQRTVIAQIAAAVFGNDSIMFFYMQATTALILILAANTAYNGFPLLSSILAQHRYLPRQLHTRGDRLAYSNGIILLAVVAGTLIYAFDGSATRLIQLYIVGVFTSFTLCQAGMVRHWNRVLTDSVAPADRRRIHRARGINAFGASFTGIVLVVVMVTKFTHGAYLVVIAIPVLCLLMHGIHRHYAAVRAELEADEDEDTLPSRVHAIVLVSGWHKATNRAIMFARATRPDTIVALTVNVDDSDTRLLHKEWDDHNASIPLTVIESPYREITRPVVDYVKRIRRTSPRDVVSVYIPEYVVGRWWENLLHNQSSLRLKGRLLFEPGVMVTSVPWQLHSTGHRDLTRPEHSPGEIRRGITGADTS
ncbi:MULTISPECIES: APC family permease [unclassified Rhodococcus (in: high G+C Gram-positive bacteria)]|uniref:APC family permease n=1 Tax=unclassified Rhodococcus (in: high G+C Gram-positive bacteria) TaxID=192944 RepID=UPI00163A2109|nr:MULTISPECIES: APC family permease [unclassified Rhodococcus (in: high G+C Gram-positive bacteria)]MBC2645026.1 APC family permease [Rhodococcus sp. 3A]MBC2898099.1 APC family permease [Rhodococcus sp. 4CII]